jgi:hypothetical protein
MRISPAIVSTLFASSASSTSLLGTLVNGASTATAAQMDPLVALKDAEKNGAKQQAAKAKEPTVKRELEAFERAVKNAKSVDDLLKNDAAMRVILTATDLGDLAQYKGLISKALKSDYLDGESVAAKVGAQRAAIYKATLKLDFHYSGLQVVQRPSMIQEIKDAYVKSLWRDALDATAPGVSNALAFKEKAATLDTAYKILGDPAGREVVTTALGLPPQIAYQPVTSQAALIERRIDIAKLKSPAYVDMLAKRYLVALNGGGGLLA